MANSYDVIVIGGGHNGLVAAGRLAKAGRKTLLLEASERLGGMAGTRLLDGVAIPAGAHLVYALHPAVERGLDLARHGLAYAHRHLPTTAFDPAGRAVTLDAKGATGVSPADAAAWAALEQRLLRFAGALAPLREKAPPLLVDGGWGDRWALLKLGLSLKRLGKAEMREFLRIVLLNAADILNDGFEDELLKAALAWDALLGTHLAPRSPGGVLAWLYRLSGRAGGAAPLALPKGGVPALIAALAAAAKAAGAEIRTAAPVARVLADADKVSGVVLAGGEEIAAKAILCTTDPKRTFLEFLGPGLLDTGFERAVRHIRARGHVAKLDLLADALPPALLSAGAQGRILLLESLNQLEESFDAAKYGDPPARLGAELLVPTLLDGGEAGAWQHLSLLLTYAPTAPRAGAAATREAIQTQALALLDARFPGTSAAITASSLQLPEDLAATHGVTGGDWHHGETTIEQLFVLRPVPAASRYRAPLGGLYLGGAGAHPGGHVTGLPGWNAAAALLEDKA